jgi:RES domain-containing protein
MPALDARSLGRLPRKSLRANAFRNQAAGFDPRSGEGARRQGGRFNPPRSFPVLYLCLSRPCVVAELTKQAERQSVRVEDLLPRELWRVSVDLDGVLDLTDSEITGPLGIADDDLVREDHRLTQEIGEAAYEHHFQAIRSWSATGVDEILAVFPENLSGHVLDAVLLETWSDLPDLR